MTTKREQAMEQAAMALLAFVEGGEFVHDPDHPERAAVATLVAALALPRAEPAEGSERERAVRAAALAVVDRNTAYLTCRMEDEPEASRAIDVAVEALRSALAPFTVGEVVEAEPPFGKWGPATIDHVKHVEGDVWAIGVAHETGAHSSLLWPDKRVRTHPRPPQPPESDGECGMCVTRRENDRLGEAERESLLRAVDDLREDRRMLADVIARVAEALNTTAEALTEDPSIASPNAEGVCPDCDCAWCSHAGDRPSLLREARADERERCARVVERSVSAMRSSANEWRQRRGEQARSFAECDERGANELTDAAARIRALGPPATRPDVEGAAVALLTAWDAGADMVSARLDLRSALDRAAFARAASKGGA